MQSPQTIHRREAGAQTRKSYREKLIRSCVGLDYRILSPFGASHNQSLPPGGRHVDESKVTRLLPLKVRLQPVIHFCSQVRVSRTRHQVIVDHTRCLHQGVTDG